MEILEKLRQKTGGVGKSRRKKLVLAGAGAVVLVLGALIASGQADTLLNRASDGEPTRPGEDERIENPTPAREADIVGVVSAVSGNQVTILKLEAADMPGAGMGPAAGAEPSDAKGSAGTTRPARPAGKPDGQRPAGSAGSRSDDTALIKELKAKAVGEEVVTVPVGIQMTKRGGEAAFTDLAADTLVRIWLSSGTGEAKVAEFLSIMG